MSHKPDFDIIDTGSLALFTPMTERAIDHAEQHLADAMTHGLSYVVERRYALDIVNDLMNEHGFTVMIDGRELASISPV
jgi:hypothetical protein